MKALELGAVETLIVYENLDITRYVLRNPTTAEEKVVHIRPDQEKDQTYLRDESGVELEVADKMLLLEWFTEKYVSFGATLEFVTNKSQEGAQFVRGFGGIGGLLRYRVDFEVLNAYDDDDFWED